MPETEPPPPRHHRQPLVPSRLGMRGASAAASGGEIVEVQGGHIVRSTGRKDRHSKVCTAKGPRDRRVRLSAHTAIQFYDVQDRLGYDRPSKAVDWLINKARAAIDELAELPPWNPTAVVVERERENNNLLGHENNQFGENSNSNSNSNCNNVNNSHGGNSGFLPPSMDSDSISDTIKSFFPMNSDHNSSSNDYPTQFHSQDLRLSLQSFDNPIFSLHHTPPAAAASHHHHQQQQQPDQTLFGYDHGSSGWADFQRMVGYYSGGAGGGGDSLSYTPVAAPLVFGNHQFVTQRGPLQSSNNNTQSIRAWIDPPQPQPMVFGDHLSYNPQVNQFSGFRVPARIRGDEEEHDGVSDKPSSASSDSLSRH